MMNVKYFKEQAQNCYQHDFNEDWTDVIMEVEDNFTMLITEDGYAMTIDWNDKGEYIDYKAHNIQ
jgi:hypothetical protein